MTITFRVILIVVSFVIMLYIIRRIRKAKMQIEDSIFWILVSFLFIMISVVPQLADLGARILGIKSTSNFVFLLTIFILLMKNFSMSIKISQLENKIVKITQNIALKNSKRIE